MKFYVIFAAILTMKRKTIKWSFAQAAIFLFIKNATISMWSLRRIGSVSSAYVFKTKENSSLVFTALVWEARWPALIHNHIHSFPRDLAFNRTITKSFIFTTLSQRLTNTQKRWRHSLRSIKAVLLTPCARCIWSKNYLLRKTAKFTIADFATKKKVKLYSVFKQAANTLFIQSVAEEANFTLCPESMESKTEEFTVQSILL